MNQYCILCCKSHDFPFSEICAMCYSKELSEMNEEKNKKPLKLHLGCFKRQLPGFVNIDVRPKPETCADVVCDIKSLDPFESNSADLIYACHVLEHFSKADALKALSRWYEVLKPGGTLRLAVPDMLAAANYLVDTGNLAAVHTMYWGSQKHEYDRHYHGWTYTSLLEDLMAVGFSVVKRYNWWETEPHNYIDDYSQSYLPSKNIIYKNGKISKIEGKLMSLNVEATKSISKYTV